MSDDMSLAVPGVRAIVGAFYHFQHFVASGQVQESALRSRGGAHSRRRQMPHVEAAENELKLYRGSEPAMYFVVPRNPRQLLLLSAMLDSQRATTGGGCSLQH